MFIRRRGESYQVIETYRERGKVKQRILANLGAHRTLAEAIEHWPQYIALLTEELAVWEDCLRSHVWQEAHWAEMEARWAEAGLLYAVAKNANYRLPSGAHRKSGKRTTEKQVAYWRCRVADEQRNLEKLEDLATRSDL